MLGLAAVSGDRLDQALLLVPFPDRNDEVQAGMLWKMGDIDPAIRSVTAECGEPDIVRRNDPNVRFWGQNGR